MTREVALARIVAIETEVTALLEEARNLCAAHKVMFLVEGIGEGVYRQNFRIVDDGEFEAWESSDWSASDDY